MGKWVQIANAKLRKAERSQVQVYLAGKMRGEPEFNFPAFLDAAEKLRRKGFVVHNPAEEEMRAGFDPKTGRYPEGMHRTLRENMRDDLCWICEYADLVVLLPGWEKSKGASAEVACAHAIGVATVTFAEAMERGPNG
jgi:hypothetical protein